MDYCGSHMTRVWCVITSIHVSVNAVHVRSYQSHTWTVLVHIWPQWLSHVNGITHVVKVRLLLLIESADRFCIQRVVVSIHMLTFYSHMIPMTVRVNAALRVESHQFTCDMFQFTCGPGTFRNIMQFYICDHIKSHMNYFGSHVTRWLSHTVAVLTHEITLVHVWHHVNHMWITCGKMWLFRKG